MTKLHAVGDIVVVFYPGGSNGAKGRPLSHASSNARDVGGDGCRGRVLKVGRKWAHVSSLGAPILVHKEAAPQSERIMFALPVEAARVEHAKNFAGKDEWRTPEFVADVLARL